MSLHVSITSTKEEECVYALYDHDDDDDSSIPSSRHFGNGGNDVGDEHAVHVVDFVLST